jgi:hypothetical protein
MVSGLLPSFFCSEGESAAQETVLTPLYGHGRLGEPPIGVYGAARYEPWLILLSKELPD